MSGTEFGSLLPVAQAQARINAELGGGSTFGEIGEAVAAAVTGSVRITGTGRDLKSPVTGWRRPADPVGLDAPGAVRTPYLKMVGQWPARDRNRYESWLADPDPIGEVKSRQVSRQWPADDSSRTPAAAAPAHPFPLFDFYVVILFDLDGDIFMARRLELQEMVDFVASDVGVGGSWNYKVAISTGIGAGTDLTGPRGRPCATWRRAPSRSNKSQRLPDDSWMAYTASTTSAGAGARAIPAIWGGTVART